MLQPANHSLQCTQLLVLSGLEAAAISLLTQTHVVVCLMIDNLQDEMKALQRLNTAYFLVGYLGFTTTWVLSLIARVMSKPSLSTATESVKGVLRVISPHYCFAQGLYDITNTYQGQGESSCLLQGSLVSVCWHTEDEDMLLW